MRGQGKAVSYRHPCSLTAIQVYALLCTGAQSLVFVSPLDNVLHPVGCKENEHLLLKLSFNIVELVKD